MGRLHYTRRHPQPAPQYKKSYYPLCPTGKAPNCYLYTLCPNLTDPPNLLYINRYLCRPVSLSCPHDFYHDYDSPYKTLAVQRQFTRPLLSDIPQCPTPTRSLLLNSSIISSPLHAQACTKKRSDLEDLTLKRRLPTLPQLVQYHRRL